MRVLRMLGEFVSTSQHKARAAELPAELESQCLSSPVLERKKSRVGRVQFATLGRGNHFVEFQRDEVGGLWLMIHTGSRGIGQAIREHHGGRRTQLHSTLAKTEEGHAYLQDLEWALAYARASRKRIAEAVAAGIGELGISAVWETYMDCHHNFVRRERHDNGLLWVHRKGAISAREGEPGIIPGSMGSFSFHVEGRGNMESLCSSSHGAGRSMSRTEARRRITVKDLARQMQGVWFDHRIGNRLRDEAPGAYKNIGTVMRAQRTLTRIVRRLEPVLVYKGT